MREVDSPGHIRRVKQETDANGETWQLRVEWDAEDGLIELAEEKMTSSHPTDAQPYQGKGRQINLRLIDYDWFQKALLEVAMRVVANAPGAGGDAEHMAAVARKLERERIIRWLRSGCGTGDPHAVRSPSVIADALELGHEKA